MFVAKSALCHLKAIGEVNARQKHPLQAERAFTDVALADTAELQDVLFKELRGRIKEADETVPIR